MEGSEHEEPMSKGLVTLQDAVWLVVGVVSSEFPILFLTSRNMAWGCLPLLWLWIFAHTMKHVHSLWNMFTACGAIQTVES